MYALELYVPNIKRDAMPAIIDRACIAADELRGLGTSIRFVRSISLPIDEICFLVFDAPGEELVADLGRRASIPFERVIPMEMTVDDN